MPTLDASHLPKPRNWQDFETLCHVLWRAIWGDAATHKNGRDGQSQDGVDIYGRTVAGRYVGVQCKGKSNFGTGKLTERELRAEVNKAKEFSPRLAEFVLATTSDRDGHIQEKARELTSELIHDGLSVDVWFWQDISEELGRRPELIPKIYPQLGSLVFAYQESERDSLQLVDISMHEVVGNLPYIKMRDCSRPTISSYSGCGMAMEAFEIRRNWFPILDVKVRNRGRSVAYMKRAEFHLIEVARFNTPVICQACRIESSYNYDVHLRPGLEGESIRVDISQAVAPDDVDRFTFTVGQTGSHPDSPVWYHLNLKLVYNEGNEHIDSGPFSLAVPHSVAIGGYHGSPGFCNGIVLENRRLVRRFAELTGPRSATIHSTIGELTQGEQETTDYVCRCMNTCPLAFSGKSMAADSDPYDDTWPVWDVEESD